MKEYNPQGGSIPHTLLPRVASYRRQPRAIESTTPRGLVVSPSTIAPHHTEKDDKDTAHGANKGVEMGVTAPPIQTQQHGD